MDRAGYVIRTAADRIERSQRKKIIVEMSDNKSLRFCPVILLWPLFMVFYLRNELIIIY